MKVALFQMNVVDYDPESNRKKIEYFIETQAVDADIVVLPEMFTTGFTMNPEKYAEEVDGESVTWLKESAKRYNKALCGSICIKEEMPDGTSSYFNRLYFITEDGASFAYDKRHLFRMAGEDRHYTAGSLQQIINYKGVRILPLVCYDLRFPVWSRNVDNGYDILIYVAVWPEVRRNVWTTLLKARAIENMAYCVGVNRVGVDANGVKYAGDTALYGFKGDTVWAAEPHEEQIKVVDIDIESLKKFREKFPVHLDADDFSILESV